MTDRRTGDRSWAGVAPAMFVVAWGGNHFSPLLLLYREVLIPHLDRA